MKHENDPNLDDSDYKISKTLSNRIIFPIDHDEIYYYVREGFQETAISEGFCKSFILTSEMMKGRVKIDGQTTIRMDMGDKFLLGLHPDYSLKCLRLLKL